MALAKCGNCEWEYPEEILSQMFIANGKTGESGYTPLICGICALEFTNAQHSTKRKHFDGPIAEQIRLRAVGWRKKHPEKGPAVKSST